MRFFVPALLAIACGESAAPPAPDPERPTEPAVERPEPPPPAEPAARVVWIDGTGALRTLAVGEDAPQLFAPGLEGLDRIHAVWPGVERLVVGAHADDPAGRNEIWVVDRGASPRSAGSAHRAFVAPDGRWLVLEEMRRVYFRHSMRWEYPLRAFDPEAQTSRFIGTGRVLSFDETGRAIAYETTFDAGPNDAPRNQRARVTAQPMPGVVAHGPPPALVPLLGPGEAIARIDVPEVLSSQRCTLRAGTRTIDLRGRVCDELAPFEWSPDGRSFALVTDERGDAVLRVFARDGTPVGTYAAGTVGARRGPVASLAFAPDGRELLLERPDGSLVRVAPNGAEVAQLGPGRHRGYDATGRYVLLLTDTEPRARAVRLSDGSAHDLGPARDARWLPPPP